MFAGPLLKVERSEGWTAVIVKKLVGKILFPPS
jgi:hypothetical protein